MRRFIVGLLATIGYVTLLAIAGIVLFVVTGPLAPKALPDIRGAVARPAQGAEREASSDGGLLRRPAGATSAT